MNRQSQKQKTPLRPPRDLCEPNNDSMGCVNNSYFMKILFFISN